MNTLRRIILWTVFASLCACVTATWFLRAQQVDLKPLVIVLPVILVGGAMLLLGMRWRLQQSGGRMLTGRAALLVGLLQVLIVAATVVMVLAT